MLHVVFRTTAITPITLWRQRGRAGRIGAAMDTTVADGESRAHGRGRSDRRRGSRLAVMASATLLGSALCGLGAFGALPGSAQATPVILPHGSISAALTWTETLNDAGGPIAQSSPNVGTLDGGGPSVIVGDRAGGLYAFHLTNGSAPSGWPIHVPGNAPIDSTPSVLSNIYGIDSVFVDSGNAASPYSGGYNGFSNTGALLFTKGAKDPDFTYGVQGSPSVGTFGGVSAVVAPSLGMEEYALNTSTGAVLSGWPFFTADSGFSTPSLVDLYGNGETDVVQGGDSTAGQAMGQVYPSGGHLRIISPSGQLICHYDTNQTVDSSTAVGNILAGGGLGIAVGTGSFFSGRSDTNQLYVVDTPCNPVWHDNLGGVTFSSPAIGDLNGDGHVEVVEGVDTGTSGLVWALNGANGAPLWGGAKSTPGRVIGSVAMADLTGAGYNDVLVPTTEGLVILDGRTGQVVTTLASGIGLQNSPLVTIDPNGLIGITVAGYNGSDQGVVQHYELSGTAGDTLGVRSWPQFHQNPQLTGTVGQGALGDTLNAPVVGMARTPDGQGYWEVAADGAIYPFGDAVRYGSMAGVPLNRPIVGMAATPDGKGYWLVASDGGIFTFGDAAFYGSAGAIPLRKPIVGMAATPDGKGYWLVASDGGIFTYGDATFYGSTGAMTLNRPIVGMAPTASGHGYWLVASDGGIFTFGDATFYGSTGAIALKRPVVGMAATPDGHGYWLVASDGGIFTFGDAPFLGSTGALTLAQPVVGMSADSQGHYWMDASDGGIFTFQTPYLGSVPATAPLDTSGTD